MASDIVHLLLLMACGWILGLVWAGFGHGPELPSALGLVVLCAGLVATADRDPGVRWARSKSTALAGACLLAGLLAGWPEEREVVARTGVHRVEAVVHRVRVREDGIITDLRVRRGRRLSDGVPLSMGSRLQALIPSDRIARGAAIYEGTQVRGLFTLRPETDFRNPTPHPPWPWPDRPQARARLARGADLDVLSQDAWGRCIGSVRARVRAALRASLDPHAAGLVRALSLGEREGLSTETRADVRDAGLAHVLAVSGLHVSVVAGLFAWALRRVLLLTPLSARTNVGRWAAAASIPVAIGFAELAGGAPSALRAALTASLAFVLLASGRRPQPLSVGAGAVILLGALDPSGATRPGFLLSILATVAVLTCTPPASSSARDLLLAAARLSGRTTLATAPIVLWCFGAVPVVGVVANVLLVPVGTLLLVPLAVAHALLCSTLAPLSVITAPPLEILCWAFTSACDAFAWVGQRTALGKAPPPTLGQGAALAIACATILAWRGTRIRVAAVLAMIIVIAVLEAHLRNAQAPRGELRITFLDVAQGDAALVDLPNGQLMLVDAGGSPPSGPAADPGKRALLPLLRARRRTHVDIVVLSHPHPDHHRGLAALIGEVSIGEVWDNGQARAEEPLGEASRLLTAAQSGGARVVGLHGPCHRTRRFGGASVQILHPCPAFDPGYDPNDNSVVLRLAFGRRRFLLTGDVERLGESQLLSNGADLRADVLKVPHHGSRTSSTAEFLAAVRPLAAVVSAGRGNPYGHPHREVMGRLRQCGARVFRTDRHGGTIVRTDGRSLSIRTWAASDTPVHLPQRKRAEKE